MIFLKLIEEEIEIFHIAYLKCAFFESTDRRKRKANEIFPHAQIKTIYYNLI